MQNSRAIAAKILTQVLQGKSLTEVLNINSKDKAFIQALCYGVCRNYFSLMNILNQLMEKPLKQKDQDIQALLLVGLYQLTSMRTPEHAAVSETVSATTQLKKTWAKNLVNAVLRNFQRQTTHINTEEANYNHPQWFIDTIKQAYPQQWQQILNANNEHPPLSLRVNQRKQDREHYLKKLATKNIVATPNPFAPQGITLETAIDVSEIPGFKEGESSVQDGAAQLATELLNLEPNLTVIDACAAPGGKAAHILELQPNLKKLLAIDNDVKRCALIQDNFQRLNLNGQIITADVLDTKKWWDGNLVDRILLDAPCSATGVIRRHPDIKLLRREADIPTLAKLQLQLLEALWPLLTVDGILVYATCSILPAENTLNLQKFLQTHQDAKELKIETNWGIETPIGRQILPGMDGMDGFYYARLRKYA